MPRNKIKKPLLKSKKIVSVLAGSLAALALTSGVFFVSSDLTNDYKTEQTMQEIQAVNLTTKAEAKTIAEKLGVLDLLAKDENGDVVRFEAIQGKPIDIIVDENSMWSMTDNVKSAIKLAISQYNELFSYINPEYSFRYISKNEYEKNPTSDPFMFFTTNLAINTIGGTARAVTSPAEPTTSSYNNGSIDSSSTIIISSTGTVSLTVEEIANVVMHEMAHALGFEKHVENKDSIMCSTGNGATISSYFFSKDVLNAMISCYYNPRTNTKPYSEINKYINMQVDNRKTELEEYYKTQNDQKGNNKTEQSPTLTPEQVEEMNLQNYISNVKNFASKNNLKVGKIEDIVGASYSRTSIYGQTLTFHFNEDGSYILEIADADNERQLKCTGSYEIVNNTAVLKGEYFKVENMQYVAVSDTIYFSSFSNGDCTYGTLNNQFRIDTLLTNVLENEYSL